MPLYHLHASLNTKRGVLPKGSYATLKMVKPGAISILLAQGVISEAETPPLSVLPGYESMGATLEAYDVRSIADFIVMLEDKPDDLARILSTSITELEATRAALENQWLSLPKMGG